MLLSQLASLHSFSLNPDDPQRYNQRAFRSVRSEEFQAYLRRLSRLALDLIQSCVWLKKIALYREAGSDARYHWLGWEVGRSRDGTISLINDFVY